MAAETSFTVKLVFFKTLHKSLKEIDAFFFRFQVCRKNLFVVKKTTSLVVGKLCPKKERASISKKQNEKIILPEFHHFSQKGLYNTQFTQQQKKNDKKGKIQVYLFLTGFCFF